MITLLARRELRSLFSLPSTWFLAALLQAVLAWFFLARLDAFLQIQPQMAQIANPPGATMMVAVPLCNMLALLVLMITPLFTMRLIAEERRNGTLPLLLSAPISASQIALGKFLGLIVFILILSCTTPLMLYSLMLGTHLDQGLIFSNLLGLTLLTSCCVSLGLYISSLTNQPIIAAIGALFALLGLWLTDLNSSAEHNYLAQLSPFFHFQNLNTGLLHSNDVLFFVLFSGFFLLLTIHRLNNHRAAS